MNELWWLFFVTLLAGLGIAFWQMNRAQRARARTPNTGQGVTGAPASGEAKPDRNLHP